MLTERNDREASTEMEKRQSLQNLLTYNIQDARMKLMKTLLSSNENMSRMDSEPKSKSMKTWRKKSAEEIQAMLLTQTNSRFIWLFLITLILEQAAINMRASSIDNLQKKRGVTATPFLNIPHGGIFCDSWDFKIYILKELLKLLF